MTMTDVLTLHFDRILPMLQKTKAVEVPATKGISVPNPIARGPSNEKR
jgi:hypothetical protein